MSKLIAVLAGKSRSFLIKGALIEVCTIGATSPCDRQLLCALRILRIMANELDIFGAAGKVLDLFWARASISDMRIHR